MYSGIGTFCGKDTFSDTHILSDMGIFKTWTHSVVHKHSMIQTHSVVHKHSVIQTHSVVHKHSVIQTHSVVHKQQ